VAKYEELDYLATIGSRAFAHEGMYGHFYPQRARYPHEFRASFLPRLTDMVATPGAKIIVGKEKSSQKIIGFVALVYYGSDERKAQFDAVSPKRSTLDTPELRTVPAPRLSMHSDMIRHPYSTGPRESPLLATPAEEQAS
jgi:hypothetical protein